MSLVVPRDELQRLERAFRELGPRLRSKGVARAAVAVGAVALRQYLGGYGPAGQMWRRNKDGGLSLRRPIHTVRFWGAGGALRGRAEDVMRWHDKTRPTFPEQGQITQPWAAAADEALRKTADEAMGR